jgi:hypothetical protein
MFAPLRYYKNWGFSGESSVTSHDETLVDFSQRAFKLKGIGPTLIPQSIALL